MNPFQMAVFHYAILSLILSLYNILIKSLWVRLSTQQYEYCTFECIEHLFYASIFAKIKNTNNRVMNKMFLFQNILFLISL